VLSLALGSFTKAAGVENRSSAKARGTSKSLLLENHTKSQRNAQNSSKEIYIIEKKQIQLLRDFCDY
jgi:hypothetical protein